MGVASQLTITTHRSYRWLSFFCCFAVPVPRGRGGRGRSSASMLSQGGSPLPDSLADLLALVRSEVFQQSSSNTSDDQPAGQAVPTTAVEREGPSTGDSSSVQGSWIPNYHSC